MNSHIPRSDFFLGAAQDSERPKWLRRSTFGFPANLFQKGVCRQGRRGTLRADHILGAKRSRLDLVGRATREIPGVQGRGPETGEAQADGAVPEPEASKAEVRHTAQLALALLPSGALFLNFFWARVPRQTQPTRTGSPVFSPWPLGIELGPIREFLTMT